MEGIVYREGRDQFMKPAYYRANILLREQMKGYSMSERETTGYCKIELRGERGRAHLSVQNLRPLANDGIYGVYFITYSKEKPVGIYMGVLGLQPQGKGELKWEFSPYQLGGMDVEDIGAVALLIQQEERPGTFICPLLGFKGEPFQWQTKLVIWEPGTTEVGETDLKKLKEEKSNKNTENIADRHTEDGAKHENEFQQNLMTEKEKIEEAPKADLNLEEDRVETVPKPDLSLVEKERDGEIPKDKQNLAEKSEQLKGETNIQQELKEEETSLEVAESELDFMQKEFKEVASPEPKVTEQKGEDLLDKFQVGADVGDWQKGFVGDWSMEQSGGEGWWMQEMQEINRNNWEDEELRSIFEQSPRMEPFENPRYGGNWVRIAPQDISLLLLSAWSYIHHPLVQEGYYRYNHLLLGKGQVDGESVLLLGAPGQYNLTDETLAYQNGFSHFYCCRDLPPRIGEYGYWIMIIKKTL